MKWCRVSKVAGDQLREEKILNARIDVEDCKLFVNAAVGTVRTSRIVEAKQSTENTLLFITASGSRYAIIFEEGDLNPNNGFCLSLKEAMNTLNPNGVEVFRHLAYTLIGNRVKSF